MQLPCVEFLVSVSQCQPERPSAGYIHANGKKTAFQGSSAFFCLEMLRVSPQLTFVDGYALSIAGRWSLISIKKRCFGGRASVWPRYCVAHCPWTSAGVGKSTQGQRVARGRTGLCAALCAAGKWHGGQYQAGYGNRKGQQLQPVQGFAQKQHAHQGSRYRQHDCEHCALRGGHRL